MMHTLFQNDRLAPPMNLDAYLEVLDPRPRDGCVKVFDAAKRADRYVEVATLTADLYAGKLTLLRAGKPRFSQAAQHSDTKLHNKIHVIKEAMRRIRGIQKQLGVSFAAAYHYAAEAYRDEAGPLSEPFPPQSTMYRYRQRELAGLPVLRGDRNKGNRSPRYSQEVINTICTLAELHYLVPQSRWSLETLTNTVNRAVRGSLVPLDCPKISRKFVRNTIRRFVQANPDDDRMLPSQAIAGTAIAKQRIRVEMPFERVEQDALHLPFVIQTPSGVSSQVWLVHAIDCCTGHPMGWRLVVGAPTDTDSLACAEMYMAPVRLTYLAALGIDCTWAACGTPGLLVFDNGAETKTWRIEKLELLGVDVRHCRARAGQEKPFIERLNLSLKNALEALAGCTRFEGKDGQRDPIALGDRLMTLEELERWIVRWLYEKWIHQPLDRLTWEVVLTESAVKGETPAKRWQHFESSCYAISLPPSRAEWLSALYEHTERTLSRKTGITVEGMNYKGDGLPALIHRHGEGQVVHVLYDPDDFRYVYVDDGDERPLVTLVNEHVRPETPAWSMREATERLKLQKSSLELAPQAQKFEDALHEQVVADSLAPKRKKTSKHERNRETAQREKHARAVTRASKQPGPMPPPTVAARSADWPSDTPPAPAATPPVVPLLDDVELLPVLARDSGGLL
ncbi:Mu transposase C-terminal domain-containing protein [Chromobacterium piscinae]|uniref:Mu transposase C-terminal domain-containing protein n=1 Tax=Chromobacterium piscinae TaxID=686831 RepID=UPI001E3E527F|nr:Mu transposase C-terminal domain-containing protein [Chromobacterium piscinae]MCD5329368.1 Mu transposase C-terminal domain-containing protein [Chromobacterium piscinae]